MPSSHQNWQYLGASGYVGAYTTTGGGGTPIVPRSSMDFLRLGVGRTPSAEYPDGYLGTIRSRRDDKGQTQRGYQRGVHKGERIDPGEYMWPENLKPDRRIKIGAQLIEDEGVITMNVRRNAPKQELAPAPHLVNDGKANISANVPAEFNPRVAQRFVHLQPRWK